MARFAGAPAWRPTRGCGGMHNPPPPPTAGHFFFFRFGLFAHSRHDRFMHKTDGRIDIYIYPRCFDFFALWQSQPRLPPGHGGGDSVGRLRRAANPRRSSSAHEVRLAVLASQVNSTGARKTMMPGRPPLGPLKICRLPKKESTGLVPPPSAPPPPAPPPATKHCTRNPRCYVHCSRSCA